MTGLILAIALALPPKTTYSKFVSAGMAHIRYRLVSPNAILQRPVFPGSTSTSGAYYFAVMAPDGKVALGAVKGEAVMLDLNGDGKFDGPNEIKKVESRPADWELGRTGTVTFPRFEPNVDHEEVILTWHKDDAVPMLGLGAKVNGVDRFSRYILCKPTADAANAPVFNLGTKFTFAPDYINLSVNLSGSLYSPGSNTEVHVEIGTQGLGENSFLGRTQEDIRKYAYVEATYRFRDAQSGKELTYLATLSGRC